MKLILVVLLLTVNLCSYSQKSITRNPIWNYPLIKSETVVDEYFGYKITDPYRNIENTEDSLIKDWHHQQKVLYNSVMSNISNKDALGKEIETYKNQRTFWSELPRPINEKLFFNRRSYKSNLRSLNYMSSVSDSIVELFNTDSINKADNVEYIIDYFEPSRDGNFVAFALSYGGTENSSIYILDVKTKSILPDIIKHARYGNPQWLPDNSGFFYQEYINNKLPNGKKHRAVCVKIHYLRTNPENDKEILSEKLNTQIKLKNIDFPLIFLSHSSDIVLANIHRGTEKYPAIYYAPLSELLTLASEKINWKQVFKPQDLVSNSYIQEEQLYYLSFKNNPKGQVMKMNIHQPNKRKILLNADENILKGILLNKNSIFVKSYNKNVYLLNRIDIENEQVYNIELPFKGTIYLRPSFRITDFYQNTNTLIFLNQSWNRDQCIMYYHPDSNKIVLTDIFPQNDLGIMKNVKIDLVEVPSHDGTKVPLTIFYNSDITLNGQNPLIIEAYGCYGYTYSPNYKAARQAWLKRGGVFAVAHVRGGGEKGEEWYRAGYKSTKPNSWKDLISCSEYLIEEGYTTSEKLATIGTSCGGIAVGRAITERPELFKAAIISVGTLNTLRHEEAHSKANILEFGTVKDSVDFLNLYEMDVFHHIKKDVNYPSMLITSGMNDARVSPWHGGKTVAKLQNTNTGNNITLYYISEGGHNRFSESVDSYSFLLWQLGHPDFKLEFK